MLAYNAREAFDDMSERNVVFLGNANDQRGINGEHGPFGLRGTSAKCETEIIARDLIDCRSL